MRRAPRPVAVRWGTPHANPGLPDSRRRTLAARGRRPALDLSRRHSSCLPERAAVRGVGVTALGYSPALPRLGPGLIAGADSPAATPSSPSAGGTIGDPTRQRDLLPASAHCFEERYICETAVQCAAHLRI